MADNSGIKLFGFELRRVKDENNKKLLSVVPKVDDDGAGYVTAAGSHYGQYLNIEGDDSKDNTQLVMKYRGVAFQPEVDMAVEDIINEAISGSELKSSVNLVLDNLPNVSKTIKNQLIEEFNNVTQMLNFEELGHDIFRRWYVDGRMYYHKVIDRESPRKGITELRYIDPRKIKKVREVRKRRPDGPTPHGLSIVDEFQEYYLYNEKGVAGTTSGGIKIAPDTIAYVPSGMIDQNKNMVLSYLHKAIKPVNQLRMIEDATVIYRIARAPERRIFKIDVGNLPKVKAEQYLRDVMARYRNKLVYDASTGEIRDDRNYMSMLEDFWLPSREGGRGTDITTLPGGQNLGEISDIEYFRSKLYRSLNVPASRLEASQGFNLGRSTEITRDELKFTKFVQRLRKKFTELFNDVLRTQLVLKAIIAETDWHTVRDNLQYDFLQDGHFAELKDSELLMERLRLADSMRDYVGKYFSVEYVRKNVLHQTDRDIADIDTQIKKEIDDGIISMPDAGEFTREVK